MTVPERAGSTPAEPSGLTPAEPRGRTEIADRVLERIAAHALTEVPEVGGAARRVMGVALGQDTARATPQVDAHVDGRLATLRMTVSMIYPAPVRQVARRLREHVAGRVSALTGLDVRQVDVDIASLTPAQPPGRRRVR